MSMAKRQRGLKKSQLNLFLKISYGS